MPKPTSYSLSLSRNFSSLKSLSQNRRAPLLHEKQIVVAEDQNELQWMQSSSQGLRWSMCSKTLFGLDPITCCPRPCYTLSRQVLWPQRSHHFDLRCAFRSPTHWYICHLYSNSIMITTHLLVSCFQAVYNIV